MTLAVQWEWDDDEDRGWFRYELVLQPYPFCSPRLLIYSPFCFNSFGGGILVIAMVGMFFF